MEIRPSGVADRPSVCAVVAVGARLNGRTIAAGGEEARDVMGWVDESTSEERNANHSGGECSCSDNIDRGGCGLADWLMRDAVGLVHHSTILFDYCVLTCRDGVGN